MLHITRYLPRMPLQFPLPFTPSGSMHTCQAEVNSQLLSHVQFSRMSRSPQNDFNKSLSCQVKQIALLHLLAISITRVTAFLLLGHKQDCGALQATHTPVTSSLRPGHQQTSSPGPLPSHCLTPPCMPPPCTPLQNPHRAGSNSPDVRPAYEYTCKKDLKKVDRFCLFACASCLLHCE